MDDSGEAVFEAHDVEIDKKAEPLLGHFDMSQCLLTVNRREILHRLTLDDDAIIYQQI